MPAQSSVAEELLLMLLWTAERLSQPAFQRLTESYEAWEWRHRIPRQLQRMEERKLLAREKRGAELVFRLTDLGRLQALGGRNPPEQWARPWDGLWRQVLFDLPIGRQTVRARLWRWLRENGFGYLQQSLWVHPHPVKELLEALEDFRDDVETFILMEARCCAGYSDEAIVEGAWDFEEINRWYEGYQSTVRLDASVVRQLVDSPNKLSGWLRSERIAWRHALAVDPLLPRSLWPRNYRGEAAWESRRRSFELLSGRLCP